VAASKAARRRSKSSASERAAPPDLVDPADAAWARAVRWLAAHDRSERELRTRLAAIGAAADTIDVTIRRLSAFGYLDDHRFAVSTAEQAARRGHGSDYVRAHLAQHGVVDDLIDAAVASTFVDETALAQRVLRQRYPIEPRRPAERAKAARFLQQRGFPEAVVLAILGEGC